MLEIFYAVWIAGVALVLIFSKPKMEGDIAISILLDIKIINMFKIPINIF